MVVKPLDFVTFGKRGLLQPAIKCRGSEYLRVIYGPEYSRPEHLARLRERSLSTKRSMALREFALGIESLERFVSQWKASRSTHGCNSTLGKSTEHAGRREYPKVFRPTAN